MEGIQRVHYRGSHLRVTKYTTRLACLAQGVQFISPPCILDITVPCMLHHLHRKWEWQEGESGRGRWEGESGRGRRVKVGGIAGKMEDGSGQPLNGERKGTFQSIPVAAM